MRHLAQLLLLSVPIVAVGPRGPETLLCSGTQTIMQIGVLDSKPQSDRIRELPLFIDLEHRTLTSSIWENVPITYADAGRLEFASTKMAGGVQGGTVTKFGTVNRVTGAAHGYVRWDFPGGRTTFTYDLHCTPPAE